MHRTAAIVIQQRLLCFFVILYLPASVAHAYIAWALPAGQTGDWSVASNWNGPFVPTSGQPAVIANGGTAVITLPAQACYSLELGTFSGSGSLQISGSGQLSTPAAYVGYSGIGTLTQSAGTNSVDNLYIGYSAGTSGSYSLTGGQIQNDVAYIGYYGTGSFVQSGGSLAVSNVLYFGSSRGGSGTYTLNGGLLSVYGQELLGNGNGACLIQQSGGTNSVSQLSIASGDKYFLGGGNLQISSGFSNHGNFAGGSTPASISATGVVDLSSGTMQNLNNISLAIGSNSLVIVPPGFDPSIAFGSYNNLGITHTTGTTLNVLAGQGFEGSGTTI